MGQDAINNDMVLLDCYHGAYGPTLRIDVRSVESLHKLRNFFVGLSKSANQEINLIEDKNVVAIGIDRFILQSISNEKEGEKKLSRIKQDNNGHIFYWKMSPDNWEQVVCLVQSLLDGNRPGHQYLTEEGMDDVLIELAFQEENR